MRILHRRRFYIRKQLTIRRYYIDLFWLHTDITTHIFGIDHLIKSTIEKFKSIHILVNNAGIVYVKKLIDTSEEEWAKTININLTGAFLFSKAVLSFMMKKRHGVIINVSSGAGKTGFSDLSVFICTKPDSRDFSRQ